MDDKLKESISAFMDDEANEIELQRILSQTDNKEVLDVLHRYYRVRDTLKSDVRDEFQIDVSASVSLAIAEGLEFLDDDSVTTDEAAITSSAYDVGENGLVSNRSKPLSTRHFYTGRGVLALAASVAFAFFFIMQSDMINLSEGYSPELATSESIRSENSRSRNSNSGDSSPENSYLLASNSSADHMPKIITNMTATQVKHFNQYLLRHAEHTLRGTPSGFLPFARVASVNAVGI